MTVRRASCRVSRQLHNRAHEHRRLGRLRQMTLVSRCACENLGVFRAAVRGERDGGSPPNTDVPIERTLRMSQ